MDDLRVVVLPESTVSRGAVARLAAILDAVLPARGRAVRRWLRDPAEALGGIWFLSFTNHAGDKRVRAGVQRIRRPNPRSGSGAEPASGRGAAT